MIPTRLTGRQLEDQCVKAMERAEKAGLATMSRYGVQCSRIDGEIVPIQSLPDFEGLIADGPWFCFDAKACSASKLDLSDSKVKARQLRHLMGRAKFGGVCFLLIHWNRRELKTRIDEAETWAMPVDSAHPFWQRVGALETYAIRRDDCRDYGVAVEWTKPGKARTFRPELVSAIIALDAMR